MIGYKRLTGVDIGLQEVKTATVARRRGHWSVVALEHCPSPPGAGDGSWDEQQLLAVLSELLEPGTAVVAALGGTRLQLRVVADAPAADPLLDYPFPEEGLTRREVGLARRPGGERRSLLISFPTELLYRYASVLCRAGLVIRAVDLQCFALWRLYGRDDEITTAILDLGAGAAHLMLLSAAGEIAALHDLPPYQAQKGAISSSRGLAPALEQRFKASAAEGLAVDRLILCGGGGAAPEIDLYLQERLGLPVLSPAPELDFRSGADYHPAYAVALGLALREAGRYAD
jgi:type IV pilus assembly protein PilM